MKGNLTKVFSTAFFIALVLFVFDNPALAYRSSATESEFLSAANQVIGIDYIDNRCLQFVSDFFASGRSGYAIPGMGFQGAYNLGSAIIYWNSLKSQGRTNASMDNIPIGADVFFNNSEYGHIGIYIGNGQFINSGDKVYVNSFWNDPVTGDFYGNHYLGWAWHEYVNITPAEIRGSEMTTGFSAVLPDGDYLIATAAKENASSFYFLDIENASAPAANNTNVSLCGPLTGDPEAYDVWTIEYDNQFYRIKQKGTNMCLDVDNEDTLQETNIQVYSGWNTNAQKWAVERNGNNGYRLRSKCSGSGNHPMCLDITGGAIVNGTNVQQWEYNNSDAQSWLLIPYRPSQPINEGRYILLYMPDPTFELDVAGNTGIIDNGTNVQIWSDTISSQYNSFDFVKLSNGYYKVVHAASGKCLEVEGGSSTYKTNVSLNGDNGSFAQQWAVVRNDSGYSLISRCNGYALDLPSGTTGNGKNIEVYPRLTSDNQRWSFVEAEYTVEYNMNGGIGTLPSQTKYYKSNLTLNNATPSRTDYAFLGWSDIPNSTVPMYQPGDVYSTDTDVTLYAVWQANISYTVTLDANGGTVAPTSLSATYGNEYGNLPEPERIGYLFDGWYTSSSGGSKVVATTKVSTADNHTLYAHWQANSYTVTLDANGGTVAPTSLSATYGNEYGNLPEPARIGYLFDGWYTSSSGGSKVVATTKVSTADNHTLYAHWHENPTLKLPSALKRIEDQAFMGCTAMDVSIPQNCEYIGNEAFANSDRLHYVYFPNSEMTIKSNAFSGCPNVTFICYEDTSAHFYAQAKSIPYILYQSGWILAETIPAGVTVTDEKWTYTQTTTSTASSMAGWEQDGFTWQQTGTGTHTFANYPDGFDTGHALYGKYAKSALTPSTSGNTKREVNSTSSVGYIYWHWTHNKYERSNGNYNVFIDDHYSWDDQGREYYNFRAFESTSSYPHTDPTGIDGDNCFYWWGGNPEDGSWWWYRFDVYRQSYTDYQKLFTYRKNGESTSSVSEGNGISNVKHWVKYKF